MDHPLPSPYPRVNYRALKPTTSCSLTSHGQAIITIASLSVKHGVCDAILACTHAHNSFRHCRQLRLLPPPQRENNHEACEYKGASMVRIPQSSGAVRTSRWTSWAPVPNKPTVSVDVKQYFNNNIGIPILLCCH